MEIAKTDVKPNTYIVLQLDFSSLCISSGYLEFKTRFGNLINTTITIIKNQYKKKNINLDEIIVNKNEYDSALNQILVLPTELTNTLKNDNQNLFRAFFATMKAKSSSLNMKIYITGVAPFALDNFTSGFNIARDLTNNENFAQLCGIEKDIVEKAIEELNYAGDKEKLMDIIVENYNGYRFHQNQIAELVNPTLLWYFLDEAQMCNKIPPILIDGNVCLSDNAIRLALSNPNASDYLEKLIFSGKVKFEIGIKKKIDLIELKTTAQGFFGLLFYLGAVTYQKNEENCFKIPNKIIRSEYIDEILRLNRFKAAELLFSVFESAIKELMDDKNIEKLCEIIKNHALLHLKFTDTIHSKEQDLKIVFLFALSLGGFPIDSEFYLKQTNTYLDLLSEKRNIHLEFQNVTSVELGFDKPNPGWDAITTKCKEIEDKTLDEILLLPCKKPINDNQTTKAKKSNDFDNKPKSKKRLNNGTVADVWESLLSQTKKNNKNLELESTKKVISFAVMRVGIYNLYYKKIDV